MTALTAIREERTKLEEQIERRRAKLLRELEKDQRLAALSKKRDALAEAEKVLGGRTNGSTRTMPPSSTWREAKPAKKHQEAIRRFLREHPGEHSTKEIAAGIDVNPGTVSKNMRRLAGWNEVSIRHDKRPQDRKKVPLYRHRETRVHAGEGVRS